MKTRIFESLLLMFLALTLSVSVQARGKYQDPADFVAQGFNGQTPDIQTLWLDDDLKKAMGKIMARKWRGLRQRYWREGTRTAWVLNEIGKERPITIGVLIDDGRLEKIRVLEFRESRGWEVRFPAFTDQFTQARLTEDRKLDRSIDNVSGATLSTRAMRKVARLALFLHGEAMKNDAP